MKKTLSELVKQDKKILAKSCKKLGTFGKIITFEEGLVQLLSDKRIAKEIKDKCVVKIESGITMGNDLKIDIILSNDKIIESKQNDFKTLLDGLIETF